MQDKHVVEATNVPSGDEARLLGDGGGWRGAIRSLTADVQRMGGKSLGFDS